MEAIHGQYREIVCSLKHGDLERLHKGVHSERRVLASLEGGVWGERER